MKRVNIGPLGEFYWPNQDVKCLDHLRQYWVDAGKALKYCKQFDTVVQAGGNVGVWPRYLAGKFKTVYTFEPNRENFKYLCMNCPEDNIISLNAALGEVNGLVSTYLTEKERNNIGAYQVDRGGVIPTFTIDQLNLVSCDLIILDIEGYELRAIVGAEATIDRFSPVIHLEDKGLSERYGASKGDVINHLKLKGYEVAETFNRDFVCVKR